MVALKFRQEHKNCDAKRYKTSIIDPRPRPPPIQWMRYVLRYVL